MKVQLSDHFTYKRIFFAVLPSILMMIFTSLYSMADGIFLSSFDPTKQAFAGVNLIWPYIMILSGVGFMIGTGGTALVSKTLGEGNKEKANVYFSFLFYATIGIGALLLLLGYFTVEPFAKWMASISSDGSEAMIDYAIRYGHMLSLGLIFSLLSNLFQPFFVTAERPLTGFFFILAAGITNIVLDAIFVGVLGWEVEGAGAATITGQFIAGVLPIFYFVFKKDMNIHLGRTSWQGRALGKAMFNGISEFVSCVASSIVGVAINAQLLKYVNPGSLGVGAYGIVMYVSFVFMAIFSGYSIGISPAMAYHYGAENHEEMRNLFHKSLILIAIAGVSMCALGELLGPLFVKIFAGSDEALLALGTRAMRLYSLVFLSAGFSIYASGFFTALNNGLVSGVISIVRSLLFELLAVFLLPLLWGSDGIWLSGAFAEIGSSAMTIYFFLHEKKRYGY